MRTLLIILCLFCWSEIYAGDNTECRKGKSIVKKEVQEQKKLWAKSFLNKPAPQFVAETWIGKKPKLKGKFILIDFWATWCGPCKKLIPELNGFAEKFKKDLVVIGLTDEPIEKVKALKEPRINYYIATDTRKRMKGELELKSIPHVLIIDQKGIVRWESLPPLVNEGLTEEVIRKLIEKYK